MKRVLSVLLSIVMLVSCACVAFAADASNGNLRFDENGKFKIMIFSDVQDGYPIEEAAKAFMNESLDKTQPDLVVLLGDNVMSSDSEEHYWLGYDEMLEPMVSRGIPFTFVFGNHDDESMPGVTKEEMLEKYMSYDGCLAYEADPALHGCATHNLEILSHDGSRTAYNLWMMDSGDYSYTADGEQYYDCVRADQIAWYESVSRQLEAENGGLVPSLMFQHIVPLEVAQHVMLTAPFKLGALGKIDAPDGTSVTYLPNLFGFEGTLMEAPCPSRDCEGQWNSLVERGDVKAMFFGHDHMNTFKADVNGVDAVNVPGLTYESSYHSYIEQGAVLVTLDEADGSYKSELVYANDLALEEGSQLPGLNGRSLADYRFSKILRYVYQYFVEAVRFIGNSLRGIFC